VDKKLFEEAYRCVMAKERERDGIGTLSEKSVHAILKYYFEPDETYHEIEVNGYYADIAREDVSGKKRKEIIEIQSRNFSALNKKLSNFLELGKVTVVYPIFCTKWLVWLDQETGEVTTRRKSPKKGRIYDILCELYYIKKYLNHPNLRFVLVMMNIEETKLLDGWSRDKKKGATKYDKLPTELLDEISIEKKEDYLQMLPEALPGKFTSADYKKATGLRADKASRCVNVLKDVGVIEQIGKDGRFYVYKRAVEG